MTALDDFEAAVLTDAEPIRCPLCGREADTNVFVCDRCEAEATS